MPLAQRISQGKIFLYLVVVVGGGGGARCVTLALAGRETSAHSTLGQDGRFRISSCARMNISLDGR